MKRAFTVVLYVTGRILSSLNFSANAQFAFTVFGTWARSGIAVHSAIAAVATARMKFFARISVSVER
jgi:hypothetical protein